MRNKLSKRKMVYCGLSLLIAVGIWLYVDMDNGTRVTTEINDIPVEYLGETTTLAERGLMLLDDSDKTVSLTVEGVRGIVAQLDKTAVRIQADLSNITSTGSQNLTYRIIYPNPPKDPAKFSGNLTVKNFSSYMVKVNIGELYSKEVDVRCEVQGTVAEGYSAGELRMQPNILEIRGQEADLAPVSYAKVVLKIDNANATVKQTLAYQFYDAQDNLLDGKGVHATVDQVQVTLPVNVTKELRLEMKFLESPGASLKNVDYTISPATVVVTGDAALLEGVESIVLDEFDLISLGGNTTYNYAISLPEGCENLSGVTRATLRIAFRDMHSTTLTTSQFRLENVPEGKTATVLTEELPVAIFGTDADVMAVSGEDILVLADLTDFSSAAGSYTVPATVLVESGGDVGVSGTYQLRVTISEKQGEET
ncbi:MAG: CdaR family protein [Oscillibacter sp.]